MVTFTDVSGKTNEATRTLSMGRDGVALPPNSGVVTCVKGASKPAPDDYWHWVLPSGAVKPFTSGDKGDAMMTTGTSCPCALPRSSQSSCAAREILVMRTAIRPPQGHQRCRGLVHVFDVQVRAVGSVPP